MSLHITDPLAYIKREKTRLDNFLKENRNLKIFVNGNTPYLHHARFPEIVDYMLEKGGDVNVQNDDGNTLLHITKDVEIASILLNHNANIYITNDKYETPHITNRSHVGIIKLIYKHIPTDKQQKRYINSEKQRYRILIKNTNNINTLLPDGKSFLHTVILKELAMYLLEHGGNVNVKDEDGNTPLHINNSSSVVRFLLENGSNVYATNNKFETPFDTKKRTGYIHIMKNLSDVQSFIKSTGMYEKYEKARIDRWLGSGKDINDFEINPPGGKSHIMSNVNILKYLLGKGLSINKRDNYENTMLHNVDDIEIAKILLTNNADTTLLNNIKKTAFETQRKDDIKNLIRQYSGTVYSV